MCFAVFVVVAVVALFLSCDAVKAKPPTGGPRPTGGFGNPDRTVYEVKQVLESLM